MGTLHATHTVGESNYGIGFGGLGSSKDEAEVQITDVTRNGASIDARGREGAATQSPFGNGSDARIVAVPDYVAAEIEKHRQKIKENRPQQPDSNNAPTVSGLNIDEIIQVAVQTDTQDLQSVTAEEVAELMKSPVQLEQAALLRPALNHAVQGLGALEPNLGRHSQLLLTLARHLMWTYLSDEGLHAKDRPTPTAVHREADTFLLKKLGMKKKKSRRVVD